MDYRIIVLTKSNILKYLSDIKEIINSDELKKWSEEQILYSLSKKFKISLGYIHKNKLIGFIFASEKDPGIFHIHKMMVGNDYRGLKIGHKLMQEFIKKSVLLDAKKISLWVYDLNKGAMNFYKRFEFKNINTPRTKDGYLIHKLIKSI